MDESFCKDDTQSLALLKNPVFCWGKNSNLKIFFSLKKKLHWLKIKVGILNVLQLITVIEFSEWYST
jgi:hypothetical protein